MIFDPRTDTVFWGVGRCPDSPFCFSQKLEKSLIQRLERPM